jgi:histidyl-tRNA synthetase
MQPSPTEFLKIAARTAEHFGFRTLSEWQRDPRCRTCPDVISHSISAPEKRLDAHGGLLVSGAVAYCEAKLHALETPVLLYRYETAPRTGEAAVTFHIFNVQKSIAEVILIQTARALANELGGEEHTVRINSLGDTESICRYSRELGAFLKKRLDAMPAAARELMKEHPLLALMHLIEVEHELAHRAPSPLEYLSDQSRKHFREIVEYLDMSDTAYEIDPKMLGHHECYSDALFSLSVNGKEDALSIRGGRFDEFLHRNTRTRTPAVGAVAILKNTKTPTRLPRQRNLAPAVYVVQLGFGPKIRSLMLIDRLRQAGVPVRHNLSSDSLSAQLREAEASGTRYTIIMGQKEFVEGTVILRDLAERGQESVPQDELVRKLKRRIKITA